VLIKVVFIEVQLNDDLDIGIEGAYVNNGLGSGVSGSAANVFGLAGANSVVTNFNGMGSSGTAALSPGTGGANGFYQIVGKDFQATLKAVAVAGKAQVLSRPSILARDGQLAKIVVGQEIYMPSGVSYVSSGTSTTTPIINGSYSDIGIILSVTPFIGANNLVEMILQPQTSTVDSSSSGQMIAAGGGLLGSSPVYAPNINIRSADTVVVTPDAQTVVIGGLISNSKSSSDNKVPLLGDIPLLGYLFKSSSTTKAKTELLMFLTPHIVQSPAQLMALVPAETHQAPAITNSVSEQELDRFLERVPVKKEPAKKTK
jgi:general secretion pathway protein D